MAVVAGLPIESVLALMLTLGRGGPTNESREVTEAEHELGVPCPIRWRVPRCMTRLEVVPERAGYVEDQVQSLQTSN